ncbi:hypothetical protein, partial [Acidimangrovimonas pyrenivorans]
NRRWRKNPVAGHRSSAGLSTSEILGLVPVRLFAPGSKTESHKKAIERALEELRKTGLARVFKDGRCNRWTLKIKERPTAD